MRKPPTLAVLASILLVAGCGGDREKRPSQPAGPTAAELTNRGWTEFDEGDLTQALADFDAAIAADPNHGPAYVGQGWSRLDRAASAAEFQQSVTSFQSALDRQQEGAEVRAGLAAARFGLGGTHLQSAINEAVSALQADSTFVFAHRSSINATDLALIVAFSLAGQGDLAGALEVADVVQASGIEAGVPATWTVDGTTYPTFEGAALAFLHKLSNALAG